MTALFGKDIIPGTYGSGPKRPLLQYLLLSGPVGSHRERALVIWFWTQSLIGQRDASASVIGDKVHTLNASANLYLHHHPTAANTLLIIISGIIDLLGIFLLSLWIFRSQSRPFVGLVIVLGLRQILQACVALPAPPDEIWHNPGFPSLLVTYGVSNDYFFSGHTAITVLAATELCCSRRPWLTTVSIGIVVFEAPTRTSSPCPLHHGRFHWPGDGAIRRLRGKTHYEPSLWSS